MGRDHTLFVDKTANKVKEVGHRRSRRCWCWGIPPFSGPAIHKLGSLGPRNFEKKSKSQPLIRFITRISNTVTPEDTRRPLLTHFFIKWMRKVYADNSKVKQGKKDFTSGTFVLLFSEYKPAFK